MAVEEAANFQLRVNAWLKAAKKFAHQFILEDDARIALLVARGRRLGRRSVSDDFAQRRHPQHLDFAARPFQPAGTPDESSSAAQNSAPPKGVIKNSSLVAPVHF